MELQTVVFYKRYDGDVLILEFFELMGQDFRIHLWMHMEVLDHVSLCRSI